ncbi:hypothetical protein [Methylomonas methanica]|uniref:Uncharacterized protein n=1 Tax=Methylomonas methanica TaxID=421 RepID=A0A177MXX5_METMH|nr:hypothetical protein [Methylomonas methanica]OAI10558.1 hypothetical protein A1332_23765 [Methylomonas methanica]
MIGRDTEWRQGCVLIDEDAYALGLVESKASDKRIVVISHDCDLPNNAEPRVEVIVGAVIQKADPMFARARNPRCLHLRFSKQTGEEMCVELRHSNRIDLPRAQFFELGCHDRDFILNPDEKRGLKQWLAARYGRPAFPNAFENRLRKLVGKKSVEYNIGKILEPASTHLVGLFFDLGDDRVSELSDGEPYFLSISVVYDATEGGQVARDVAEKAAIDLEALFYRAYGTPEVANEIALEKCNAVADTYLTLADLRKVDQWRLEYISLRETPVGDFFAVGESPS